MKYRQNKIAARNIVDSEAQEIINLKTRGYSMVIFSGMTKGFRGGTSKILKIITSSYRKRKARGIWVWGRANRLILIL